jgi:hypothetical protein
MVTTFSSRIPEKAELRSELEGLGAVIAPNEDGRLSEQARHLSPDTESGKLASFVWMTAAQCQEPEDVISVGEDLIIARGIDAPTTALTHFMVGDAFSDMLCLPKTPSELKTQRFRAFMRSWCDHDELSFRRPFRFCRLQFSKPYRPAGGDPRASSPTRGFPKERSAALAPPALRPALVGLALAMVARLAP